MKNDSVKNFFDGITPVPYSKEFTEKVMDNLGDRIPIPYLRIFLLIVLWGGILYTVLESPEFIMAYIDSGNVVTGTGKELNYLTAEIVHVGLYCLRMLFLVAIPVLLSIIIIYDSVSVSFDKLTQNLMAEYERKNCSL